MKASEQSLCRLNSMLQSEQATVKEITDLVLLITDLTGWKLKVIDFNLYDENLLEQLKKDKTIAIKKSEYEKAASFRDQEILCEKHIAFKKQYQLKHSIFHFENGEIWYCYVGKSLKETELFKSLIEIQL